jgi:hypothetical protein
MSFNFFHRGALAVLTLFFVPCAAHEHDDSATSKEGRLERRNEAFEVKTDVAEFDKKKKVRKQKTNGDEERYCDLRGSFGKTLRHTDEDLIDQEAFRSMLKALRRHKNRYFDQIILGNGVVPPGKQKVLLSNPQASLAFFLDGNDSWINTLPPAPKFASDEAAGEMVELYWAALSRDVPFNEFSTSPIVAAAVDDLNTLTDFKGPKIDGFVTPETFLKGNSSGSLIGPFVSQFLYQTIPFGPTTIPPFFPVAAPGIINDFLTDLGEWSNVINGGLTNHSITTAGTNFARTPRDLTQVVHTDFAGQISTYAALLLNSYGPQALDPNNPYFNNPTQSGFITYGQPYIISLMQIAAVESLKAAWYQKWQVHRRLRPEEFGFFVNGQKNGIDYGISPQVIDSPVLPAIFSIFGSYLLPQAYPEGCPPHPSYPAGHATYMGATITILKAYFNENFPIKNPLMPDSTNTSLVSYPGTLLVGDELNKLAENIAFTRDMAGVHWRSDSHQGLLLGEKVAIDILKNFAFLFNENFKGFTLTKFNGEVITVGAKVKD